VNNDKIGELYDGRIGTAENQSAARRRLHWMCARVQGDQVLDLGCSQGVASILVGRDGRTVAGVDRESRAIEAARERLATEPEAVRARVSFRVAEASDLPFAPESFDTVLLGEVIEHQVAPADTLASVERALRPGGTLVLTTPYGLFRYHDHKESIYLGPLVELLEERFAITEIELIARYLAVVAVKRPASEPGILRRALEVADQRVQALDDHLDASARATALLQAESDASHDVRRRAAELTAELEAERLRAASATSELEELRFAERKLRSDLGIARLALARAEAERDEAKPRR